MHTQGRPADASNRVRPGVSRGVRHARATCRGGGVPHRPGRVVPAAQSARCGLPLTAECEVTRVFRRLSLSDSPEATYVGAQAVPSDMPVYSQMYRPNAVIERLWWTRCFVHRDR